jgi:hypothetical protein
VLSRRFGSWRQKTDALAFFLLYIGLTVITTFHLPFGF